jgi:glycosyltransferase involved in cell wall biosynthesis
MMNRPTVSVVVPTVDRPSARAAILSALNQTLPPLEVIVAVDRADERVPEHLNDLGDKVQVVFTGGIGPGGARMQGSMETKGEIIAFLDDDDKWFPEKLEQQLAMWPTRSAVRYTLMSCRYFLVGPSGQARQAFPTRLIASDESIAQYLFRRTRISVGETSLHTSTLMCDRDLLAAESWDYSLRLHEDWDWLLRVGARPDVEILMAPDVLVGVSTADRNSLSMTSNSKLSSAWVKQRESLLTRREFGDFLLVQTAVLALRARDRRAALAAAWYALTKARPGLHAWLVWALHMPSPKLVDAGFKVLSRVMRTGTVVTSAVDEDDSLDGNISSLA